MRPLGEDVADPGGLADVRASARGWHGAQLAVLGFIGLCGVLQGADAAAQPRWLQVTAGLLVLSALVLECLAVVVVASVAWPLQEHAVGDGQIARVRRRLRTGVAITFVAVGVLALGTASSWWPREDGQAGRVRVVTTVGSLCGELRPGERGVLALDVDGRAVLLALEDVAQVAPVDSCR